LGPRRRDPSLFWFFPNLVSTRDSGPGYIAARFRALCRPIVRDLLAAPWMTGPHLCHESHLFLPPFLAGWPTRSQVSAYTCVSVTHSLSRQELRWRARTRLGRRNEHDEMTRERTTLRLEGR